MARDPSEEKLIANASMAISRMQTFDVQSLRRESDLGRLHFGDAVEPATRLIELYGQLPVTVLESLPTNTVEQIRSQADADFNRFSEILSFDPARVSNPGNVRDSYVRNLGAGSYNQAFQVLSPWISFAVRKSTDFTRLENEARALIQAVRDESAVLKKEMEKMRKDSESTLETIRKTAAEQGVSQQAAYFKQAADNHEIEATFWLKATVAAAAVFAVFAGASFFIHKIPPLIPTTTYETVQITVSKVLLFAVLSFFVYLTSRNYLSHKHNAIVNKHRQDALATFRALVDAAKDEKNHDIVLNHAAACIFGPQSTGYSRDGDQRAPSAKSVIELLGPLGKAAT